MIVFIFFAFFQCCTVILCVCPFYFSVVERDMLLVEVFLIVVTYCYA